MSGNRIPELDVAIKWKTMYDILKEKAFKDETDRGTIAALFCVAGFPLTYDTAVRWKALCDVLRKEPFKLMSNRRGIIAALLLMAIKK